MKEEPRRFFGDVLTSLEELKALLIELEETFAELQRRSQSLQEHVQRLKEGKHDGGKVA